MIRTLSRTALSSLVAFIPASLIAQPVNDSCSAVAPVVILSGSQHLFTGDNTGGTAAGDAVPGSSMDDGFPRVWHAFILQDCGNVTIDYCGNTPSMGAVSSALITTCPADDPVVLFTSQNGTFCGDGNPTFTFDGLAAGTYWLPVFSVFNPIGPYQVQVSVASCTGGPGNDECGGAYNVPVVAPVDCPGAAVLGSNATGSASAPAPSCIGAASYADVWYRFDPGADTVVVVHAEVGTATAIGIEVFGSCGGAPIHCAIGALIDDTVVVVANTEHRVRVFTDTDNEVAGSFGICINTLPPPIVCDGDTVLTENLEQTVNTCQDGVADPLRFITTGTSTEGYSYFLCDTAGIVLAALNGDSLNADTLALGSYHVYGFSFNGTVNTPFVGAHIDSLGASGACAEASTGYVLLGVEICSRLGDAAAATPLLAPNPCPGWFVVKAPGVRTVRVADASGRSVLERGFPDADAAWIDLPHSLGNGCYAVTVLARGGSWTQQLVLLR